SLNTGQGKTYCSINASIFLRRKPIIIVNNNKLLNQWKESIVKFTNVKESQIYILQGKNTIRKIIAMKKSDIDNYKYYIAMTKTLDNAMEEDSDFLNSLKEKTGISLKIFDEIHQEYRSKLMIDMSMDAPSIYLSATPERSDRKENFTFQNIYCNVPKLFTNDIKTDITNIPDKYHTVVMYRINSDPSELDKADFIKASARRGINVNHYSKYLMEDEEKLHEYMEAIYKIVDDIVPN